MAAGRIVKVAVVSSDRDFVTMLRTLGFGPTYDSIQIDDQDLIRKLIELRPDAILLNPGAGSIYSGTRVAQRIRRDCNVPLLWVHDDSYPADFPWDEYADADASSPQTYSDFVWLTTETIKLACRVLDPNVRVELHRGTTRRTIRWTLTMGLLIAVLSGGITFALTQDLAQAGQAAGAAYSAITATSLGSIARQWRKARQPGRYSS